MLYRTKLRMAASLLAIGSLLTLDSCRDALQPVEPTVSGARLSANFDFYVLSDNNQLLKLNTQNPSVSSSSMTITGLQSGERLVSIDFRPATGQLYSVSSNSRLYVINLNSGVATPIGAGPFMPPTNGDAIGFDFNPTVDRIRLVTNQGQNLRLNPETGGVANVDGAINGVAGAAVTAVAYTNNRAGVTTTTLYDIDPITDQLYRQNPPNDGRLELVGSLGVDIAGTGSFDIGPDGSAIATLISGNTRGLYQIDLASGAAERLGDLPNVSIVGLAIPTEPVAYAVTSSNMLWIFNPMNPTPIAKQITGLQPGEDIYGIDFRPVNGQLYALGSTSRIYTINTSNGAAMAVGAPFSPGLTVGDYGFDFNPTVDRIRLISNSNQNLRLNPDNGAVAAVDGMLTGSLGGATGAAYTNNFAGATTTTLYSLSNSNGQLFIQNPPNNGTLVPVGGNGLLGLPFEGANGFDIGGTSNIAYAILRSNGMTRLYTVNLTAPSVTAGAMLPGNPTIRGFAVGLGF